MELGFVGLGLMGFRMARNLLKRGENLIIWNRSREKAEPLEAEGARVAGSLPELGQNADAVFTVVSDPEAVLEVASAPGGFLDGMRKGSLWVDCSTVNPSFSRKLHSLARERDIRFMDAPVTGSTDAATKGDLEFLVGGDSGDVDEIRHAMEAMGSRIVHVGSVGMGTSLKLVVNLLIGQAMAGFSEAVTLGAATGIDRSFLLDYLLGNKAVPPVVASRKESFEYGRYEPGFPLKLMHKDLHLAQNTAHELNVPFLHSGVVRELYKLASLQGYGEHDCCGIYEYCRSVYNGLETPGNT